MSRPISVLVNFAVSERLAVTVVDRRVPYLQLRFLLDRSFVVFESRYDCACSLMSFDCRILRKW